MVGKRILTVGSLNMDQVVRVARMPVLGETLLGAGSLKLVPGGKGANQAVAMARLGASVAMAGRVGSDPFGAHLLAALQADGVDTALVVEDAQEASGVAFIFLASAGDNAIVVASGSNMRMGEDADQFAHILEALPGFGALVLQLEIPLETVKKLIEAGYSAGVPVVLNLAPAQALPEDILRQVEVLILNETEASFIGAALARTQAGERAFVEGQTIQTLDSARDVATRLHGWGIRNVVITLGGQGALLARDDETGRTECIYQAAPRVEVVDTTAAGDCFAGALTVALTEGQSPAEALRFAVYASALKVTKFGAQSGLPTRAEVEKLLAKNS